MWQFFKVEGEKRLTQAWAAKWPSGHWHFLRMETWSSRWPRHCVLTQGTSWAPSLQRNYRLSSLDLPCPVGDTLATASGTTPLPELPSAASPLRGRTSGKAAWATESQGCEETTRDVCTPGSRARPSSPSSGGTGSWRGQSAWRLLKQSRTLESEHLKKDSINTKACVFKYISPVKFFCRNSHSNHDP